MDSPLISLIIPCYNVERWLPRCLDTLLAQTYDNIELVTVCDGSPDRTADLLREYAARDARIKPIFQENMGISMARNNGLDVASGRYIGFVDSDDYVEPDYVESLYRALIEARADAAACGFWLEWEQGRRVRYFIHTKRKSMSGAEAVRLSFGLLNFPPFCWNKLFKRELFGDGRVRFPSHYYEDMATLPRLFISADKVAVTNKPLYHYIRHPSSVTRTFGRRNVEGYLRACNAIRYELWECGLWDAWSLPFHRLLHRAKRQIRLTLRLQHQLPLREQNELIEAAKKNLSAMRSVPDEDVTSAVLPFPLREVKTSQSIVPLCD